VLAKMQNVCYSLIHAKLRQFLRKLAGGPGWIRFPSPAPSFRGRQISSQHARAANFGEGASRWPASGKWDSAPVGAEGADFDVLLRLPTGPNECASAWA
jgi:hypothetical protein